ncbi:MAG: ABC transporter ATP-binding protein [Candidatus Faecousia sp.]|nr:ABC transporter ATP-binding protein [Clostridiales bacterium]MDY6179916.1 ABC transporter ATP-binding protein [Candidatus Faecousia sp.]
MRNITKIFPGIVANDNITLQVKQGEVHALLGENGAGKSTLMSVLFGMYEPEEGSIYVRGKKVAIKNPSEANRLGIGMVHQHFKLVDDFTTLENIVLGVETTKHGVLKMDEAREKVLALSTKYGLAINPDSKVHDISVGMQQRVEILKMLYRDNDILIFDEPTAVLTPQEIDELMKIMRDLVNEGKSVVFISHKLNEIKRVADRCTVLRKGKCVDTVDVDKATPEMLSRMMVGRNVQLVVEKDKANPGEPVLEVRDLCVKGINSEKNKVSNVSFQARKGEITCIAGIDNNGQTELVLALAGMIPSTGSIRLNGEEISDKTVRYRNTHGMSHIPEDRQKHGLILEFNLAENLIMQNYFTDEFNKKGFLRFDKVFAYANELIQKYDIRSGKGAVNRVRAMSGGNQQKAILAREITRDHDLLIAVQPTRGLDVGAIEYIHKQLIKERDAGKAVLLISLELDEVMDVSDRILVIHEGEIVADVLPEDVTFDELGLYMSGTKRGKVE